MSSPSDVLHNELASWFDSNRWEPFQFQREAWGAYAEGRSGLIHAPTGFGKTLSVWLGPVNDWLVKNDGKWSSDQDPEAIRVLWITPLRALASDTAESLRAPIRALDMPWTVEQRTGDTSASVKARQRMRLPTCLVTTPESLSLIISQERASTLLSTLEAVVVDEWHELIASKRGSQTELALARLRAWNPDLRIWGLSATIANLDQAAKTLVGTTRIQHTHQGSSEPKVIVAKEHKAIEIDTIIPREMTRFPWSGHIGTSLVSDVCQHIEGAKSSLVFCNTRSQVEIWYDAILKHRPDWLGRVSLHHGSLERDIRDKVEQGLKEGRAKAVVCTSSLDLGVDFSPVEQVFQIGSPKGVARLLQRAGRSGHSPGAVSRVIGVPTHAFELIEFAAARAAAIRSEVEPRTPLSKPLDVLVQHIVTIALGGGFTQSELYDEVRTAASYESLTREEFEWALNFVTQGGPALTNYPEFQRVERLATTRSTPDTSSEEYETEQIRSRVDASRFIVQSDRIARMHRMNIGTITSDSSMRVRYLSGGGGALGTIEESFIARLSPGDCFVFAGRVLEFVRAREMTAYVKKASKKRATVPRWGGGRSPLSTMLSDEVKRQLRMSADGERESPELVATARMIETQKTHSRIPAEQELLIEYTKSRDGYHAFIFPFQGRLVHEGIGALIAFRLTRDTPSTYEITANDYGIELLSPDPIGLDQSRWRRALSIDALLEDMLHCVNSSQLARRAFRDVARIAGLVHPGFPGSKNRGSRQLQASSEMFFDVFMDFDPTNMLLDQARREVLEQQLEFSRLRHALGSIATSSIIEVQTERLTPLAFPLFAERLRTQSVSSERWSDRIKKLSRDLDRVVG